ncbi:MAG: LptF/LptG family permease [Phycisphaerae bacterium]|nr:LptF/LptG family permease [Phycisphaerae bacterium]
MKTLDRYIVGNFLISTALWFVVMMSLRIVVDLFVNIDEFAEKSEAFTETVGNVAIYYGANSLTYFARLGGVIIVAGAITTLYVMNHTNELVAMLAAGMSLHRVVWPIILCAMLLGGLIIVDQEIAIPPLAPYLVRERDDVHGTEAFGVDFATDTTGATWLASLFTPATETMDAPLITIRRELTPGGKDYDAVASISGTSARPASQIKLGGQHGWNVQQAVLDRLAGSGRPWKETPNFREIWTSKISPQVYLTKAQEEYRRQNRRDLPADGRVVFDNPDDQVDEDYGLTIKADRFISEPPRRGKPRSGALISPQFIYRTEDGQCLGIFLAGFAAWRPPVGNRQGFWELTGGRLFYPTDLNTEELVSRKHGEWLSFLSTSRISELVDKQRVPDMRRALLIKHIRFADPINNLVMLLLGLPFILSRQRNIKASAGLCLLMVGAFYAFVHVCRYTGLSPTLAAWLPAMLFGPVSVVMLDSVKT